MNMENYQKMSELASAVQKSQAKNSVIDLVYNEETGQFAPSTIESPKEGAIVTQMTQEGYA